MPGMFDLTDIFQFIIYRFDQIFFSKKDFISHIHGSGSHIFVNLCNEMNSTDKKSIKE